MKHLFTIMLISINIIAYPQLPKDTSIYKVTYLFRHMTDTTKPNFYREENMVLYIGKRVNQYSSLDQYVKDSLMKKQFEQGNGFVINTSGKKTTSTKFFIDNSNKVIIQNETLLKNYFFDEPYPNISWKITSEVRTIGNWKCTKAEGYFKGRTYEAWFTTEIPATGGPWKLTGLPGVILEANDTKKQVQFIFTGIENNYFAKFLIKAEPENGIKTSKSEFTNMREAAINDPMGFINSTASEMGSALKMTTGSSSGNFKPKKPNNPIELKEE